MSARRGASVRRAPAEAVRTYTRPCAAAVALGLALAAPAPAGAGQTASQRFFAERLAADERTSPAIASLLRTGGFVDERIRFGDLTGDGRSDAIVRVQSGGAAGAVAAYVFSSHGTGELRPVFRAQRLTRASVRLRRGRVAVRYARYRAGDGLCCPSRTMEARLRWSAARERFVVAERVRVDR